MIWSLIAKKKKKQHSEPLAPLNKQVQHELQQRVWNKRPENDSQANLTTQG